jgi:hypothetical protein
MRYHGIYIFLDDGRCVYSKTMAKDAPSSSLITGILTAFQAAFYEISGAWPRKIISGKYQFIFEKIGPLTICKVIDAPLETDEYLSEIGLSFIKKYGSQLNKWHGDRRRFSEFSLDLDKIIPQQLSNSLNPEKPLDAFALLNLNEGLGGLSKYIIEHEKKIHTKDFTYISKQLDIGIEKLKEMIDTLIELGYLGYIIHGDEEIEYFV